MTILSAPARKTKSNTVSAEFVSVVIRVNDHKYSLDPLPPGAGHVRGWRLTKHSARESGSYDVIQAADGLTTCSCPSYTSTHAGTSSLCKHARSLVTLGLLPSPACHDVTIPVAETPCCTPTEAEPCTSCLVPGPAPGLGGDVGTPDAIAAATDPGDALTGPETWPAWTDDAWGITPEPIAVELTSISLDATNDPATDELTPADRAEAAEVFDGMAATAFLDHSDRLTLDELTLRQVEFYRGWGTATGEMFARALEEVAFKVKLTGSRTPAEYEARSAQLDEAARETWLDAGRMSCACQHEDEREPELSASGLFY